MKSKRNKRERSNQPQESLSTIEVTPIATDTAEPSAATVERRVGGLLMGGLTATVIGLVALLRLLTPTPAPRAVAVNMGTPAMAATPSPHRIAATPAAQAAPASPGPAPSSADEATPIALEQVPFPVTASTVDPNTVVREQVPPPPAPTLWDAVNTAALPPARTEVATDDSPSPQAQRVALPRAAATPDPTPVSPSTAAPPSKNAVSAKNTPAPKPATRPAPKKAAAKPTERMAQAPPTAPISLAPVAPAPIDNVPTRLPRPRQPAGPAGAAPPYGPAIAVAPRRSVTPGLPVALVGRIAIPAGQATQVSAQIVLVDMATGREFPGVLAADNAFSFGGLRTGALYYLVGWQRLSMVGGDARGGAPTAGDVRISWHQAIEPDESGRFAVELTRDNCDAEFTNELLPASVVRSPGAGRRAELVPVGDS